MPTPIEAKVAQLRASGVVLGTQVTAEVDAGYGGRMQQFSNFTVYYHAVMGSVAHEVHGGIRAKYLELGGHGPQPSTGQRLLGFPLSDEIGSDDHRFRVNRFEWGAIYWGFGGVALYGNLYTHYRGIGGETGRLGYPVSDVIALADGRVAYFEYGALYSGTRSNNAVIEISYSFPQMGQPWMVKSNELSVKDVVRFTYLNTMTAAVAGALLNDIFGGRLFLKETGSTTEYAMRINPGTVRVQASTAPGFNTYNGQLQRVSTKALLRNRMLHDLVLKFPTGNFSVAPHSVYIRETWTDFKFIHATDTHVSRRVDIFRKFFQDRGMMDAVNNLNNFNDRFREFIQYANKLWREGKLDFVMITGDLVDYCFEDSRKHYGHNNYVFLEELLLGKTGKPDQVNNEELLVPIFTSLGNHDYRVVPYYPKFTVDVQFPLPNKEFEQYGQFNLTKDEATILSRDLLNVTSMLEPDTAFKMIRPDVDNAGGNLNHYFRRFSRDASYLVTLGTHSLVMIDGRWDAGVIDSTADAVLYFLGTKGEAEDNFAGGSPDSVGFRGTDIALVNQALQRTGLTLVGVHAPAINPKHSDYSYFLREQIRASNPAPYQKEMRRYLFRRDPYSFKVFSNSGYTKVDLTKDVHTDWSRTGSHYFHEGLGGDLLDYGVMRGMQADFLKLCVGGLTSPRPVDLVLSGHVHKNWECKVKWNAATGKFRFFHDFYTENPAQYYHSVDTDLPADEAFYVPDHEFGGMGDDLAADKRITVKVDINPAATNTEVPQMGSSGVWSIKTKPYANTLNAQSGTVACKAWWQNAKPLLIQTASLGQSEFQRGQLPQPDFRGCRWISVTADTIDRVSYITLQNIQSTLAATLPGGDLPGGGISTVIK